MRKNTETAIVTEERKSLRNMAVIAMLGAISMVLMLFEIPLWFAPSFYEMDLSEVPVLVGTFALGPLAGALIELVKILLKLVIKGTNTAFVGDIANYVIGCALVLPASFVYQRRKTKKNAVLGMVLGTAVMTAVGCVVNAYVLLPVYGKAFGMPIDVLISMGTAVNPAISGLGTFVLLAVAPFNILKGVVVSVITLLLYKYVSPILKGNTVS